MRHKHWLESLWMSGRTAESRGQRTRDKSPRPQGRERKGEQLLPAISTLPLYTPLSHPAPRGRWGGVPVAACVEEPRGALYPPRPFCTDLPRGQMKGKRQNLGNWEDISLQAKLLLPTEQQTFSTEPPSCPNPPPPRVSSYTQITLLSLTEPYTNGMCTRACVMRGGQALSLSHVNTGFIY